MLALLHRCKSSSVRHCVTACINSMNHISNGADSTNRFSRYFLSNEGCRMVSSLIVDESKFLSELKKFVERRISLDEQYAKNLQDLSSNFDRVSSGAASHSMIKASREISLHWSKVATSIAKNAETFRQKFIETSLKDLIEQKNDSRKFLDEEKRNYETEQKKFAADLQDFERRYLDECRSYSTKLNDFNKSTATRKLDESKIKSIKENLNEKRANLCRTHNDYVYKIREYQLIDEENLHRLRSLLNFQEEIQIILARNWLEILDGIDKYSNTAPFCSNDSIDQIRRSIDLRRVYDEFSRSSTNQTAPLTTTPIDFNLLTIELSSLNKLRANRFFGDPSTNKDLKQKIEKLTTDIEAPLSKLHELVKDKQNSPYFQRRASFLVEQQNHYSNSRATWARRLRDEIRHEINEINSQSSTTPSDDDSEDEGTDRLEDQPYFHGVIPRVQAIQHLKIPGDYLVRLNENHSYVLSVVWSDQQKQSPLRDGHFIINERNNLFSLQSGSCSKSSVQELLSFYRRKKLPLREDGTRLIRPIARPSFIISNDDVKLGVVLGKGNFGQVLRGEYQGRPVAVKQLHATSTSRTDFINEALLLQQYVHKNIVKFIGLAAIRDPMMIVMELVERGSLNSYVKENDLRVSQLTAMCCDIAKGMAYLESNNVIHRDLAARNCLIDRKNRVKVADFGLSRCLESDETYFVQTKEVPVRWWAVEVFSNQPYTTKSDVWSYGITAWEVFSKAELPYSHIPKNYTVMQSVQNGERLQKPDKCPPKTFQIIASCWAKAPEDRPTFAKILENLKREKSVFS